MAPAAHDIAHALPYSYNVMASRDAHQQSGGPGKMYRPRAAPFNVRTLPDGSTLGISGSGDHTFFAPGEEERLRSQPSSLSLMRQADLKSLFFLANESGAIGTSRLLASRRAARRETIEGGTALHIIV